VIQHLKRWLVALFLVVAIAPAVVAEELRTFGLDNGRLACNVTVAGDRMLMETITLGDQFTVETDGGFALDLVWTGWQAPGLVNNAENPVTLTAGDFRLVDHETGEGPGGGQALHLLFKLPDSGLRVRLSYLLQPGDFFVRRRLALSDPDGRGHFLHRICPLACLVVTPPTSRVAKPGGFGQPAALTFGAGGAFFGLEYPAAQNNAVWTEHGEQVNCSQLMGQRVGTEWVVSEWVVMGLTPDPHVRLWFDRYLDSVRVAPLRPYILYNSWYDLRAPEMVEHGKNVMNVANVERIMAAFHRKLTEPFGIGLDAFVLDDGWDVYRSDWVLRDEQFPGGLGPVARGLAGEGTDLGIWFGPTGGYSHRDWRLEWMGAHDYEHVGGQLCLAGDNYRQLFKQRVMDMVIEHQVGYFKWDGIQFSCSEPDHGHPTGPYSRRAVLETVIDLCRSVREANPSIFLNVTSGTWLSPWWTRHADTIWMQGYDYGYADVPSISRRGRAITYRDCVLYDGLVRNDFWFPIANLMTHGIIKGDLQKLGGEAEPLDTFTDNAVLYFARGVAMWELYITPDLLTDAEWSALARAMHWARDRFDILDSTVMIGGDPARREAYGYAHFEGSQGILALRNPSPESVLMEVTIGPELGLDPAAQDLVLDRTYPSRLIDTALYRSGITLLLDLDGYETAIYELYPLAEADGPLLAGVVHEVVDRTGGRLTLHCLATPGEGVLLNPETVTGVIHDGERLDPALFRLSQVHSYPIGSRSVGMLGGPECWDVVMNYEEEPGHAVASLALLWDAGKDAGRTGSGPVVTATLDGEPVTLAVEEQPGRWSWHRLEVDRERCQVIFNLVPGEDGLPVEGSIRACEQFGYRPTPQEVTLLLAKPVAERPMPPSPRDPGELRRFNALPFLLNGKQTSNGNPLALLTPPWEEPR